ncbi:MULTISPECIES: DUF7261 family protein [Halobacterium]|uniref:DUF7261 family protein n=1 Tax=Halobacterium TaxID=2239 RepID=UPI001966A416|nr:MULTISPECIES: hypothetical protein [Halobacterium]MCF2166117.1 hypothetical protein [Halobacterium salinarum]MCF2166789.1 hypothetical protein [Halobacterium salinarum]MCF2239672.1 hypothetical protein [Halobacterium salinarum]QRY22871.1 hypothetical protein JT689_02260 [Halobacterium sp. GSL-19]WOY07720.1 hypothetical protein QSJ49_13055 [Halobacterium salinarum]
MTQRGQFVLAGAAVAALALASVAVAYLQFGYAPSVATPRPTPSSQAATTVERAVAAAATDATGMPWAQRRQTLTRVQGALAQPPPATAGGAAAVEVTGNATAAAGVDCPTGRGRRFGGCVRAGGVVVQRRAAEAVVVAVAYDIRVRTVTTSTEWTRVQRPGCWLPDGCQSGASPSSAGGDERRAAATVQASVGSDARRASASLRASSIASSGAPKVWVRHCS